MCISMYCPTLQCVLLCPAVHCVLSCVVLVCIIISISILTVFIVMFFPAMCIILSFSRVYYHALPYNVYFMSCSKVCLMADVTLLKLHLTQPYTLQKLLRNNQRANCLITPTSLYSVVYSVPHELSLSETSHQLHPNQYN